VVACKIKHLQKCFRAINFRRLCRGRKNVVKCFILHDMCNHGLNVSTEYKRHFSGQCCTHIYGHRHVASTVRYYDNSMCDNSDISKPHSNTVRIAHTLKTVQLMKSVC